MCFIHFRVQHSHTKASQSKQANRGLRNHGQKNAKQAWHKGLYARKMTLYIFQTYNTGDPLIPEILKLGLTPTISNS